VTFIFDLKIRKVPCHLINLRKASKPVRNALHSQRHIQTCAEQSGDRESEVESPGMRPPPRWDF
jgi:hypothetical protein